MNALKLARYISRTSIHHLKPVIQRQIPTTHFCRFCHDDHVSSTSSDKKAQISSRIVIHNLPICSSKEVYELVEPYGKVIDYNNPIERQSRFLTQNLPTFRYAFVLFETQSEADKAISFLNGTIFKQRTLNVKLVNNADYRIPGQPRDAKRLKSYKPTEIKVDEDTGEEIDEFEFNDEHTGDKFTSKTPELTNIDTLIFLINRFNIASLQCVKRCVKDLEEKGIENTENAILILMSTGDLMRDVNPKKRFQFTERVWSVFERGDVRLTVPMFNALMKVYIENNHKFNGLQMLSTMQSLDLKPDADTYGLVISSYSEKGDIENASMIIDYMSADDIPLNPDVLNNLMKGFFRAGDIDGAINMMDVMRENDFQPGTRTYNTLLGLFAEFGNLESMKWIMSEMERQQISIRSHVLFNCIVKLYTHSQDRHVPEIMAMLEIEKKYFKDAIACIKQLIQHGLVQKAYDIYIKFFEHEQIDSDPYELRGRFILNAFAANDTPFSDVCPVICDMEDRGNKRVISEMTKHSMYYENHELVFQCFELMKKRGQTLRGHMLWPLFLQHKNNNNLEGLLQLLKKNKELIPPEEQGTMSPYIYGYFLPVCENLQEDCMEFLSLLESEGLDRGDINFAYYCHLAMNSKFDEALEFGSKNEMAVNDSLFVSFNQHPDLSTNWKQILQVMNVGGLNWKTSANVISEIVKSILTKTGTNPSEVVDYFMSMKFYLSQPLYNEIRYLLRGVPRDLIKELETWHIYMYFPRKQLDIKNISIEKLEDLRERRPDVVLLKEILLTKYCVTGNVEKVEELISDIGNERTITDPMVLRSLAFFYAFYKKDVTLALKYINILERERPEFDNYFKGLIYTLELLSKEGRVDDGKDYKNLTPVNCKAEKSQTPKELMQHALLYGERHRHKILEIREKRIERDFMDDAFSGILKNLAEKISVDHIIDIIFALRKGYNIQNSVATAVIQAYIDRDETENAIEAFGKLFKAGIFVKPYIVYIHLMEKAKSIDQIQKVMDMMKGQGDTSDWNLMFSCVWCGKLKEAQIIVERKRTVKLKKGFYQDFEDFCEKLENNGKITELENLVKLTNELEYFDKSIGIIKLIKGYVSVNDVEKAKDLVLNFEEEITRQPVLTEAIANQFHHHGINPLEISPIFKNLRKGKDRDRRKHSEPRTYKTFTD